MKKTAGILFLGALILSGASDSMAQGDETIRFIPLSSYKTATIVKNGGGYFLPAYSIKNSMFNYPLVRPQGNVIVKFGPCNYTETANPPLIIIHLRNKTLEILKGVDFTDTLELKHFDPKWIQQINILKDRESLSQYGERGEHGVIIVDLKESAEALMPQDLLKRFRDN